MLTSDLLTMAGAAIIVTILMEVLKRALAWGDDMLSRWGPLMALALGVVIAGAAALYQGADAVQGVLTGVLAGASASGLYDSVSSGSAIVRGEGPAA